MNYPQLNQMLHLDVTLDTSGSKLLQRLAPQFADKLYLAQHPKAPVYLAPESLLIEHLADIPIGGYPSTPIVYYTTAPPQTPVTPAMQPSTMTQPPAQPSTMTQPSVQAVTTASQATSVQVERPTISDANNYPDYAHYQTTSAPAIYTDGSHAGGVGGWAYIMTDGRQILYLPQTESSPAQPLYANGHLPSATNNTAELRAIYKALDRTLQIGYKQATIFSDSMYCINSLTKWYRNWQRNGWKTASGKPVENQELIRNILALQAKASITYQHVRAHNGDKFNEMVDQLANQGRLQN